MIDNWTVEQIENHVDGQLEFVGLARLNEKTKNERLLLFHLYVAAAMFFKLGMENLSWSKVRHYHKLCKKTFFFKNFITEMGKTKKKEKISPTPPIKEENKEESPESLSLKKINKKSLDEDEINAIVKQKRDAFWAEIWKFKDKYTVSTLERFLAYWGVPVNDTTTLYYETKRFNLASRLKAWSKDALELQAQAAEIRLERTKAKQTKPAPVLQNTPQQDAVAKKRAADNDKLFAEIDKAKEESVSLEEFKRTNPENTLDSKLAKVQATLGGSLHNPK